MIHLTVNEIVTSIVLYSLVHAIMWVLGNFERVVYTFIRTERGRLIHSHVKQGHVQSANHCKVGDCQLIASISVDQLLV
jgi:hypothetical protein